MGEQKSQTLNFTLCNDLSEIKHIYKNLDRFLKRCHLSPRDNYSINLALEEWFINIVKYGYGDQSEHHIQIGVDFRNNILRLTIIDDGRPFNPLEYPLPDLQKPLEERKIGGVGLHLIQNLMDTVNYNRQNETNILVLEKKVTD